jgi:uncharacterized protein YhfF
LGEITDEVRAFVEEARRATGEAIATYDAFSFGDSPALADELAALVVHGPKRATAGLLAAYEADHEPVPVAGTYSVVLDGAGNPVCLIRTRAVEIRPVGEVDEAFAWDEGEGDRTLRYWREAHDDFFGRSGFPYSDASLVVLERFDLIYPLPHVE